MEKHERLIDCWMPTEAQQPHSRNVCVAVRFRPHSAKEVEIEAPSSSPVCLSTPNDSATPTTYSQNFYHNSNGHTLTVPANALWTLNFQNVPSVVDNTKGNSYIYDYVFDETVSNESVFNSIARDIVHASVKGVNGTIFAYGQTSSGKTYTMLGNEEGSEPGIIIRSVSEIFNLINAQTETKFTIKLSFLEVYNEKLIDLMAAAQNPAAAGSKDITIQENADGFLELRNLDVKIVVSPEEVFKVIKAGERVRHSTGTQLNERSSRSHSILRLRIEATTSTEEAALLNTFGSNPHSVRVGVLNLVDLAGSEGVSRAQTEGERKREGGNINRSLLALSQVISQLSELAEGKARAARQYINFRDSKLTRLLSDSLGGNSQTAIICNCSPAKINYRETCSTLEFAHRAKAIRNKVKVNVFWSDEYNSILKWKVFPKQSKSAMQTPRLLQSQVTATEKLRTIETENEQLKQERKELEARIEALENQLHSDETIVADQTEDLVESDATLSLSSANEYIARQLSNYKLKYRYSYGSSLRDLNFRNNLEGLQIAEQKDFLKNSLVSLDRCARCSERFKEIASMRLDNSYLRVKIEQLEYIINNSLPHRPSGGTSASPYTPIRPARSSTLLGNQLRREIRQSVVSSVGREGDQEEVSLGESVEPIADKSCEAYLENRRFTDNASLSEKSLLEQSKLKDLEDSLIQINERNVLLKKDLEISENRGLCLQQMLDEEIEKRFSFEIKCNQLEEERSHLLKAMDVKQKEAEADPSDPIEAGLAELSSISIQTDDIMDDDAELNSQKFELKETKEAFIAIEREYYKLERELEACKEAAYNDQQDANMLIASFQKDNQILCEKSQHVENQISLLKKEIERLHELEEEKHLQETVHHQQLQQLQTEKQNVADAFEGSKQLVESYKSTISSLSSELASEKQLVTIKNEENEKLNTKLQLELFRSSELQQKGISFEKTASNLEVELEAYKEAVFDAENRYSVIEIQCTSLRTTLENTEQQLKETTEILEWREAEAVSVISALNRQINSASGKIDSMEKELKTARLYYRELEKCWKDTCNALECLQEEFAAELQMFVSVNNSLFEFLITKDVYSEETDDFSYLMQKTAGEDAAMDSDYCFIQNLLLTEGLTLAISKREHQHISQLTSAALSLCKSSMQQLIQSQAEAKGVNLELSDLHAEAKKLKECLNEREVTEEFMNEQNKLLQSKVTVLKDQLDQLAREESLRSESAYPEVKKRYINAIDSKAPFECTAVNATTAQPLIFTRAPGASAAAVDVTEEFNTLRKRIYEQETLISSFQQTSVQLEELKTFRQTLLEEKNENYRQIDNLRSELMASKECSFRLQSLNEELDRDKEMWKEKSKKLEESLESLSNKIQVLESRCTAYEQEIKALRESLISQADLNPSVTDPELLQMEIKQLHSTQSETQQELVRARHQIDDLLHQIRSNETFNVATKELHAKVGSQSSLIRSLKRNLLHLTEEKNAAESRLKMLKVTRMPVRMCEGNVFEGQENVNLDDVVDNPNATIASSLPNDEQHDLIPKIKVFNSEEASPKRESPSHRHEFIKLEENSDTLANRIHGEISASKDLKHLMRKVDEPKESEADFGKEEESAECRVQ